MPTVTGKDGTVTIDANTVLAITGFSFDEAANPISDTNLNDAAESNVGGRTSWNGSIEVNCLIADAGQVALAVGTSVAVIFFPEGILSGDARYTGVAIVTGRSQAVADEAMVTQTFTLTGSGALVEDTVP